MEPVPSLMSSSDMEPVPSLMGSRDMEPVPSLMGFNYMEPVPSQYNLASCSSAEPVPAPVGGLTCRL